MSGYHHHSPSQDHHHGNDHHHDHGHGSHGHDTDGHGAHGHDPHGHGAHGHSHSGHDHHQRSGSPFSGSLFPGLRSRRAFLGDFGRGTLALAVFTPVLAACSSSSDDDQAASNGSTATDAEDISQDTGEADADTGSAAGDGSSDTGELRWARAQLGFVSAYVLARGNTAAIVDTGTSGSAEAIGQTLADIGLNYSNVAHVILTHHHGDHVGSIDAVLANTPSATVYAGEADLGQISVTAGGQPVDDTRIQGLVGGEDIFGFEAVATPGHTAGHMAVIDHAAGLLVAGDAIFTEGTAAVEGPARFFADVPESRESIARMAELSFNTLLVGHGEPLESGADAAVAALAASFG